MRRRHHVGSMEQPKTSEEWMAYYSNPTVDPQELLDRVNAIETSFHESLESEGSPFAKNRDASIAKFNSELPILRVIAQNPNCPLEVMSLLLFMVPADFMKNPAISLYLLENPQVFTNNISDYLDICGNNNSTRRLLGASSPNDIQQAIRDFLMGPVIAEISEFEIPKRASSFRSLLPRKMCLFEKGFVSTETGSWFTSDINFYASSKKLTFYFNFYYWPDKSRSVYYRHDISDFVRCSRNRQGDWNKLIHWVEGQ